MNLSADRAPLLPLTCISMSKGFAHREELLYFVLFSKVDWDSRYFVFKIRAFWLILYFRLLILFEINSISHKSRLTMFLLSCCVIIMCICVSITSLMWGFIRRISILIHYIILFPHIILSFGFSVPYPVSIFFIR